MLLDRKHSFLIAIPCALQFYVTTTIAMFFYGGGTSTDHGYPGYAFWDNWISDLGQLRAFSGADNSVSCVLFSIAMTTLGVAVLLLTFSLPCFFKAKLSIIRLARLTTFFGLCSGGLLIALLFFPADIQPSWHSLLAGTMFWTLFAFFLGYGFLVLANKTFPRWIGIICLIAALASLFMNIAVVTPVLGPFSIPIQKFVAYVDVAALIALSLKGFQLMGKN